jgi:hypothetical protein
LNNGDFFLGKGEWIGLLGFNFSNDHNYKLYLIFISQPKHIASQKEEEAINSEFLIFKNV